VSRGVRALLDQCAWCRCGLAVAALMTALLTPVPVHAEPPGLRPEVMDAHKFDAEFNETLVTVPVSVKTADGVLRKAEFQLTIFRPAGAGPFPVAVFNHGRGFDRDYPSRIRGSRLVYYFLRRGIAVLVPTRVGYGGLGLKPDPEIGLRSCSEEGIELQIASVAAHNLAALAYAKTLPWADTSRVIVSGASVGGYTSIAAAARGIPGAIAVMNFAGGAGGNPKKTPGKPCGPDRITKVFAKAGETLRAPTLWVYAENDLFWGAALPRMWHDAFKRAGGVGPFVNAGVVEGEGHNVVFNGFHVWRRSADAFLAGFGFKSPMSENAPARSGYAALDDVSKLPAKAATTEQGYRSFLRSDIPRTFALAPSGAWSIRAGKPSSMQDALTACAALAKQACKAYAVDDEVVWK
jgi:dienelactone hydrolase